MEHADLRNRFIAEKKYADMVRNAPMAMAIVYKDGKLESINNAFSELTGYSTEELQDVNWNETLTPKKWEQIESNIIDKLSHDDSSVSYEKECICKDGNIIPVQVHINANYDELNNLINYLVLISSISADKLSLQSLKDNAEMVRGCFLAVKHPIAVTKNGILYRVNQAFCNKFGYEGYDEIYNKSILGVIHKSEHEKILEYIKLRIQGEEAPTTYTTIGLQKDGSSFPMQVSVTEFEHNGSRYTCSFLQDITSQILYEKRIFESEEKYREVVENAVIGVSTTTLDGEIVYANKTFANMCGFENADGMIKKSIISNNDCPCGWKNESDRIKMTAILKKEGSINNYKIDVISKDGKTFHIMFSGTLSNNLIYGMFMDITKEWEGEIKIKENEEKYRALYDNAIVALLRTDFESGKPCEANNAAASLFGYESINELKKEFIYDLHFIDPDRNSLLNELNEKGCIERIKLSCKRLDDALIWIEASLKLNRESGFIDWVLIDISDKVQEQEKNLKLSMAIEQSAESIAITDKNGLVEYANPRFEEITGFSLKEITGKNLKFLDSGYHDEDFFEHIWDTISSGEVWHGAFLNKRKNGELFWEKTSISPIKNELGEITNYVSIKEDITEKKKLIEDLRIAKEKAEESDRLKSAFLANMSHEIRTPMNGIIGFTNLLKDNGLTGEEQKEYLEIIEESGERMLNTIQDIIDISKIETGEVNLNYSDVNLNEQVHYLYDFFNLEAKKKGLHISYKNGLTDEQATIKSDKLKITSIFTNLVKNAVKYTSEGSIEFGYNLKNDKDNKELEIYVRDTGIGIAENKLESIFERFVQADIGDTRVYEGTGLGLSITKAYVEMLNGKICVESEEGVGSTFFVTLPYDNLDEEPEEISVLGTTDNPCEEIKKLKILIADDEKIVKMYLGIILKDLNKEIIYAKTGVEAIERYAENTDIDLILMDIKMPEMDGFEATHRIRELDKDVYIIIQTAFAELGTRAKAIEAGANNYITKPIEKKKLLKIIRKVFS